MKKLILLFTFSSLLALPVSAQVCNPNIPLYSQPGCVETPQTSSVPDSPLLEGPSWDQSEKIEEHTEDTTIEFDQEQSLRYVQSTLSDLAVITKQIDTQRKYLLYFSIDPKKLKSELLKKHTAFTEIETLLKQGDTTQAQQQLEELDVFVSETFLEMLNLVKQTHTAVSRIPNKKTQALLRRAFRQITTVVMDGDSSTASELLTLYAKDIKKHKNLYAKQKLTKKDRKQIQDTIKKLENTLTTHIGKIAKKDEPRKEKKKVPKEPLKRIIPVEIKKVEVKKPVLPVQSDVYKRINEGIQRQTQFDSWSKVYDLGSGIR